MRGLQEELNIHEAVLGPALHATRLCRMTYRNGEIQDNEFVEVRTKQAQVKREQQGGRIREIAQALTNLNFHAVQSFRLDNFDGEFAVDDDEVCDAKFMPVSEVSVNMMLIDAGAFS